MSNTRAQVALLEMWPEKLLDLVQIVFAVDDELQLIVILAPSTQRSTSG